MSGHAEFLVEIGCEELPPKSLPTLERAFRNGIATGLCDAEIGGGDIESFATPRRLAVLVHAIPRRQPTRRIEKRGPPTSIAFDSDGNATRAATAFAEGCGVEVADLERLKTSKGEWLNFTGEREGETAERLLPDIVSRALADLPIAKRMRWGASEIEFVRPVHWVVMLLGNDIVPATIMNCAAGRATRGHRVHAPEAIELEEARDYAAVLAKSGHVIANFSERRGRVREGAQTAAQGIGGRALIEDAVLDEVAALVEWPVSLTGRFDEKFLTLPPEVLTSTLQDHQKYFPVQNDAGSLLPYFIATSNLNSRDPDEVTRGNERVVSPRLADAAFFFKQDTAIKLEARRAALDNIVFERQLGSVGDKSRRVAALGSSIADQLDIDRQIVERAAALAKTDLVTAMVGEFPELQGRMGYYYSLADGEPAAVATAIDEHYWPRQAGTELPRSDAGRVLALADRLDTLAGIFAIGKRPTGSKDPFGLRRAALGIVRILIEDGIDLDLVASLDTAARAQPVEDSAADELQNEIYEFIIDRLRAYCLDGHAPDLSSGAVTPELFESVRQRAPLSPFDFHQRLVAVHEFMQLEAGDSLAQANKRIANILRGAADDTDASDIDPALFESDAERSLHEAIDAIASDHDARLRERDYGKMLAELATLKAPVDEFFDAVMVMADDPAQRRNRLAQLHRLRHFFLDVADLSYLPQNQ